MFHPQSIFEFTLLSFSTLITLINPLGITPIFLVLTSRLNKSERKSVAKKGILAATTILLVFALIGTYIFKLYSITIDAFRIMGGIIFFRSGLRMLEAKVSRTRSTPKEEEEGLLSEDIAISPVAIPLIAGPGAITASMILSGNATTLIHYLILILMIFLVMAITYFILLGADKLSTKLGTTGMRIIQRLMGIILMVIAVQFVINGVTPILTNILKELTEKL
ncbi:MAG: NAAT family transporter [Candidatus Marinimicrobia bacterium]|nr:NAAT family transporter [Candidatus Neomarinimicrobiota bacterium]